MEVVQPGYVALRVVPCDGTQHIDDAREADDDVLLDVGGTTYLTVDTVRSRSVCVCVIVRVFGRA
jgi:hypothetical protein